MKKKILIILIVILFSSKVFADNLNSHPIGFKESIVIALENNQELKGMKSALSSKMGYPKINIKKRKETSMQ